MNSIMSKRELTECEARHFGPWAIELDWFRAAVVAVNRGLMVAKVRTEDEPLDYTPEIDKQGVAMIRINGAMMKGGSKYGGANSIAVKRTLRNAAWDASAKGIMLLIDSPGGTVAGTEELAAEVASAKWRKPVYAHISDLGASAAYWVASQAQKVYATATSEVGSIGTLAVVVDSSEAAKEEGYKVHVVATGAYKGTGVEGAPITDEQLSYLQERVADMNAHFLKAVAGGRGGRTPERVAAEWGDGRVWIAEKAASMGLIDGVLSFDDAYKALQAEISKDPRQAIGRAERLHRMAELGGL
jgi:signal peptide peptidase SppA